MLVFEVHSCQAGPIICAGRRDCWQESHTKSRYVYTGPLCSPKLIHFCHGKLVGISLNCWPSPHVQSMVWATDSEGLALLLYPPSTSPRHDWMETLFTHADDFPRPHDYNPSNPDWVEEGISQCFANRQDAVEAEIAATGIIVSAGKKVDTLLTKYQTSLEHDIMAFCEPLGAWDPQAEGAYDGASIHPFETMFMKTNRGIDSKLIENLSKWTDQIGFSSYSQCSAAGGGHVDCTPGHLACKDLLWPNRGPRPV